MLLHIGALHLDRDRTHQTIWHSLLPQTRLVCTLLLVFAIALTPNGHWHTWGVYSVGLLSLILISRVPLLPLIKRVVIEFLFINLVLVGSLFHQGGEIIWQWGSLQVTTVGLTVLGSVMIKAFLSLLMLNVLTLTTTIPALLQALVVLKTPPLLVAISASMYRYIEVLIEEFQAMRRAALSRNLMNSKHWQRLIIGNMMGSLFIRSYERGERIHQAMLARGYNGIPVVQEVLVPQRLDFLALTLTITLALLGQMFYLPV
ncbi:MAG: cobalt ECF transporter T component CbiQ [Leptolyngbyaceae bacterium]|nr:cobalt ECF transporter T component CbiQ [Leptolyngbyaceae bacterium]